MPDFDTALAIGAAVVVVAIVAVRLGARLGLPSLLLFLGLGMVLGDAVLGIQFSDAELTYHLSLLGLAIILAEGGLTTKWGEFKVSAVPAALLATLGVAISIAIVALFAYLVLGFDFWLSILLGAVLSPTDAAAVFAVLRTVPIPSRIRGILEAESGLNDAPTILLVVMASAAARAAETGQGEQVSIAGLLIMIAVELLGGVVLGILAGWLGSMVLKRLALPVAGLYPIAAFTWVMLAYSAHALIPVSGFAAAYVCAVIVGNSGLPHRTATRSFVEGIGWLAQIGLFVMLGLLAEPSRITVQSVLFALGTGAVLTFLARPLSVWLCTLPFVRSWPQRAFLSWAGLRGAVPIVLTAIPLAEGVPGADRLFDIVLVFVIIFTLLQAPTLPWVARKLKLSDPSQAADVEVEIASLDRVGAELVEVPVGENSGLAGLTVSELRLPEQVSVSLVVRDGVPFTPEPHDRIKLGDALVVVAPSKHRDEAVRRLKALTRGGRLARWRGVAETDD